MSHLDDVNNALFKVQSSLDNLLGTEEYLKQQIEFIPEKYDWAYL